MFCGQTQNNLAYEKNIRTDLQSKQAGPDFPQLITHTWLPRRDIFIMHSAVCDLEYRRR